MPSRFLLLVSCLLFLGSASAVNAQTVDPDYLDGHIYLKLQDTSTLDLDPYLNNVPVLNTIFTLFQVDTIYHAFSSQDPLVSQIYRLEFSDLLGTGALISQLQALSFVDYAEPVPLLQIVGPTGTAYTPNDPDQASQWALTTIRAFDAWDIARGDSQVVVAIIDNAVMTDQEDLANVIYTNTGEIPNNLLDDDLNGFIDDVHGWDAADSDPNPNPPTGLAPNDPWSHGTHCAGIAGAETDNGIGIASIGFGIRIMPIKGSLSLTPGNTLERAYEGLDYAIAEGADIISMSWGGKGTSLTGARVIALAQLNGITMIAAAGNNNDSTMFYPAAYNGVIAVGSTDSQDLKSGFSNYGSWVDVMAPGSGIYSCLIGGTSNYGVQSGTSMACPMVAGLAGLILSRSPGLSPAQVKDIVLNTAVDIETLNPGYEGQLGAGRINAFDAISLLTAVQQPVAALGVSLSPNPVAEDLLLRLDEPAHADTDYLLTDLSGRSLLQGSMPAGSREARVRMHDIPAGVYLFQVHSADRSRTFRVLRQ